MVETMATCAPLGDVDSGTIERNQLRLAPLRVILRASPRREPLLSSSADHPDVHRLAVAKDMTAQQSLAGHAHALAAARNNFVLFQRLDVHPIQADHLEAHEDAHHPVEVKKFWPQHHHSSALGF